MSLLIAAIPMSRHAGRGPDVSHVLVVRSDARGEQVLDARRDADVVLEGPAGRTLLRVRDGEAWIAEAPCRNHICQRLGRLRGAGRSLVCVPNHILVRFVAGPRSNLDSVTF